MILDVLKRETRPSHDRIEANLNVLDPELSRDAYRRLLERFWGFYAPVEARLESVGGWSALGLDGEARRKTPALRRDLVFLGAPDPARAPVCADLPVLDGIPWALGCMYVLEGATLGGAIISRHLNRTLGVSAEWGCTFFSSYGEERGAMWRTFCQALGAYASGRRVDGEIVDGACETFAKLDRWLSTKPR